MKLALNRVAPPFQFEVENESGAQVIIDASSEIGGENKGLRPMELVASGLAGCIAIDLLLILEKKRINTDNFKIAVEARRREGTPSPFEEIHLLFSLDPTIDRDVLTKTIRLVIDKYCSVSASLAPHINVTFEIQS